MSLTLHSGEQIRAEGRIHWSSYVRPASTALITCILVGFGFYAYLVNNHDSRPENWVIFLPFALLGFFPLLARWVQNRARVFVVTSQRIYIEEGVISKVSTELPLGKINDVSMRQTLLQRIVGAGDIVLLTGNDLTTSFQNMARPDTVREAISEGR